MKYVFYLLFMLSSLYAKNVVCAIPKNIHTILSPLFQKPIDYTHMQVITQTYPDNIKTLQALENKKAKFAIIRSDILWHLQKGIFKEGALRKSYITISTLPYMAQLFLVRSGEYYDMDLENLKEKTVSVSSIGEENGYLFKSLLGLYDMAYGVHYKSLDFRASLQSIKNNEIDAFFGFLPPSLENDTFHFQSIFSEQTTSFLKRQR